MNETSVMALSSEERHISTDMLYIYGKDSSEVLDELQLLSPISPVNAKPFQNVLRTEYGA